MMQSVIEIDMADFKIAVPAVLTILMVPLTFSIAEGIGIGLIAASLLALATNRARSLTPFSYAIAAVFFLEFFNIWPFRG
jgi:AGZA family xanthine/uracil permease-like MFS transporter